MLTLDVNYYNLSNINTDMHLFMQKNAVGR